MQVLGDYVTESNFLPNGQFFTTVGCVIGIFGFVTIFNFRTTQMTIYMFMFYAKHVVMMSSIQEMKMTPLDMVAKSYNVTRHLNQINSQFESLFSHMPFMTISYTFMSISGYLNSLMDHQVNTNVAVGGMIPYGIETVFMFVMILTMSDLNQKVEDEIQNYILELKITNGQSIRCAQHTMTLEKFAKSQTPTGLGNFSIDKLLIIPFLGSLISFSALFIQLTQSTVNASGPVLSPNHTLTPEKNIV